MRTEQDPVQPAKTPGRGFPKLAIDFAQVVNQVEDIKGMPFKASVQVITGEQAYADKLASDFVTRMAATPNRRVLAIDFSQISRSGDFQTNLGHHIVNSLRKAGIDGARIDKKFANLGTPERSSDPGLIITEAAHLLGSGDEPLHAYIIVSGFNKEDLGRVPPATEEKQRPNKAGDWWNGMGLPQIFKSSHTKAPLPDANPTPSPTAVPMNPVIEALFRGLRSLIGDLSPEQARVSTLVFCDRGREEFSTPDYGASQVTATSLDLR